MEARAGHSRKRPRVHPCREGGGLRLCPGFPAGKAPPSPWGSRLGRDSPLAALLPWAGAGERQREGALSLSAAPPAKGGSLMAEAAGLPHMASLGRGRSGDTGA